MEIVLLDPPDGDVIAWEEQFGARAGQFVLTVGGSVVYRHPDDTRTWHAGTLDQFRQAAAAWHRYNAAAAGRLEPEQLIAAERLRSELWAIGVLDAGELWSVLADQAEHGLL